MHATPALLHRPVAARAVYATITVLLTAAIALEVTAHGTGYSQLAAFALGPDLALFFGAGANLERGQLHPRAVGLYNVLHRYWLPVGLLAVSALGLVPHGFVVGALAWCVHISLDRTVGYGLRTRDGFQRR